MASGRTKRDGIATGYGSVAINGFLYQILHHVDWLASVRLRGALRGSRLENPLLVLEPAGGGDAKAEAAGFLLVEQYKTRKTRAWSLADVTEVLADLRKAVEPSHRPDACYRFVTNGRPGTLAVFRAFLDNTGGVEGVDELDDSEERRFSRKVLKTDRGFFEHIDALTRRPGADSTNDPASLLHLLSRFEMEFHVNGEQLAADLDRTLRRYAPDPGKVLQARDSLVGALTRKLAPGEVWLDVTAINAMLVEAGLSPERAHRVARLQRTMSGLIHDRLQRLGYRPDLDVRAPPRWPPEKPVLLLAGESGVGKTWQLGCLIVSALGDGQVATLVPRTRDSADLVDRAVADFWEFGLGEKTTIGMQAFANHLLEHDDSPEWLIVAADDVRDPDVVRDLVHLDWPQWGMRLVLTVPDMVAKAVDHEDAVEVHRVMDFTIDELSQMLDRHGYDRIDFPPDLQRILRKPILAGTLVQLQPGPFPLAPNTEYEVFERFWGRIATRARVEDGGVAMALGARVLESGPYPLPLEDRVAVALEERSLEGLQRAGWLREDEGSSLSHMTVCSTGRPPSH